MTDEGPLELTCKPKATQNQSIQRNTQAVPSTENKLLRRESQHFVWAEFLPNDTGNNEKWF